MSETQHTPGPWTYCKPKNPATKDDALDFGIHALVGDERKIIAEAFGRVNTANYAPAEANARLIAAAPELLECCKLARISLELRLEEDNDPTTDQLLMDTLTEIIDKAELPA